MINKKITIIGAGNMGPAMARGMIQNKITHPKQITLCDPRGGRLEELAREFGDIEISIDNKIGSEGTDIVILAVKPHLIKAVCQEITEVIEKQLIISIAVGIRISSIKKWLGKSEHAIVRVMPNTPAQVGMGMSGWTGTEEVTQRQRQVVMQILQALGEEVYFENEDTIDIVSALSGSGPAYFYYFIEAIIRAGEKLGLSKKTAEQFALQTAFGAIGLLKKRSIDGQNIVTKLREEVTSPGGITEAAIRILEREGLEDILQKAMKAAACKAKQLSESAELRPTGRNTIS